jgi:3-methyladenine DNA glycosylase/8-oxoguanine DNA glycosylase
VPKPLALEAPPDYVLSRDVCSYGYFLLEPNHWRPRERTFTTTIALAAGAATFTISQTGRAGSDLLAAPDRALARSEIAGARAMLARMLRLDEPREVLRAFHRIDPRWKRSGRGRLMRSPTLFEDVLKTVTSCNVAWTSTIIMNRKLALLAGHKSRTGLHAFPTPGAIAKLRPSTLRARCSVGYRDARMVELARMFNSGELDPAWFESPGTSDEQVRERLLDLPGVGPYAAANILQLLGRYGHLPLDTESVRHGRTVLGFTGTSAQVMKKVRAHFEPFGEHRFRSYWFELWDFYEAKRGKSWTWERETTGKTFTAAALK